MTPEHLPGWTLDRPLPHIPQPKPVIRAGCSWGFILTGWGLSAALLLLAMYARGAETLPAVSPPTDWTGVAVVVGLGLAIFLPVAYAIYVKAKAGTQFGEEFIDKVADKLHQKMNQPPVAASGPLTFDGITFADQQKLDEYKAAKAIVDSHKGTP